MKIYKSKPSNLNGKNFRIAVILSRFNDHLGNELFQNTLETLLRNGVSLKNIALFRVPGALEIPFTANILAQQNQYDAIITLGLVIKGDTPHFDYVCDQTYRGLMDVSLQTGTPVIFGVLTVITEKQAADRTAKLCMTKGKEFAEAALEMAHLANDQKKTNPKKNHSK